MGDAMGEARVALLVGHAGKVVVVGESGAPASAGGGVAHRGHLLECDADAAARGVSDGLLVHISEAIFNQAVSEEQSGYGERAGVSMGIDTKIGGWFELQAAYLSDCSVVLPLRPSARAAPPLGPRLFHERLRAWERVRVLGVSMGADKKAKTRAL